MARKILTFQRLSHIPFKFISRTILGVVLVAMVSSCLWVLWKVFSVSAQRNLPVETSQVELLQNTDILEIETYEQNPNLPALPPSPFPTSDLSPLLK